MSFEPLDLIAELEDLLHIEGYAMDWPIGMGKGLKGIYDRQNKRIELYRSEAKGENFIPLNADGTIDASNPLTEEGEYQDTLGDIDLLNEAGNKFDLAKIAKGEQTPVFFGSALTNFGVKTFLDSFLSMAPGPSAHETVDGDKIQPDSDDF